MEANEDREQVKVIALVKIAAALDVQAVVQRAELEYKLAVGAEKGDIDPKRAKRIGDNVDKTIKDVAKNMDDALEAVFGQKAGGAVARADEIINKARAEQEENDHDA